MTVVDLQTLDGLEEGAQFGAFHLIGHELDVERSLALARAFFALPAEDKRRMAQNHAFRGYSEMRGERDCREQVHFGPEDNQWPSALGPSWREEIEALMRRLSVIGARLLEGLAAPPAEDPYLLLKLIRYPAEDRIGVAPHCDFSWLTLIAMDGPGLAVRDRAGAWHEPWNQMGPRGLFVDIGELLELHSHGRYRAAPHRVRVSQGRVSLPFFVNPAAAQVVEGVMGPAEPFEHVHRVLPPGSARLRFGEAEWRRKGLGRWCYACCD